LRRATFRSKHSASHHYDADYQDVLTLNWLTTHVFTTQRGLLLLLFIFWLYVIKADRILFAMDN
jgi:hypothetical protein